MTKTTKENAVAPIQIYVTTDYDQFNYLKGNRKVNQQHVDKIIDSMRRRYSVNKSHMITIITVNEKMEVLDGQHRLLAHKALNAPVHYIIQRGYTVEDVQALNANSQNWNPEDYLSSFCELGKPDYLKYRQFKNRYGFSHDICLSLLYGTAIDSGNRKAPSSYRHIFKVGDFKVKNMQQAEELANSIFKLEPYTKYFKNTRLVLALISLSRNPDFSFDEFLHKLSLQPLALKHCGNVQLYKELIEEIYNWRRTQKVNLRF